MANQNSNTPRSISQEHESLIVQLTLEAEELVMLIADGFPSKESNYLIQSLFLVLRQMGYFFTEDNSPLLSHGSSLSASERDVLERIKDIRDGIAHRESPNNYLKPGIKLFANMNFKENDVVVQYGSNEIYLVKEIFHIHRKLRNLFASASELKFLSGYRGWEEDERKLQRAEESLTEKLKDPVALLRLKKRIR